MSAIKFLWKLALTLLSIVTIIYGFYLVIALWIGMGQFFAGLVVVGICMTFYGMICLWD